MTPAERRAALVEKVSRATMDDAGWCWDSSDEPCRDIWRRTARIAITVALEEAADVAEIYQEEEMTDEGGVWISPARAIRALIPE